MKDSAYWNIFISGQKQILEVIYTKYYDHLLNYGLKLYPDMDFVKDCIQDLFVKLYSSKNIKPTEHVRSYLLKSIRNIIIDKLNKDKLQITDKDALFHLIVDEDELEKNLEPTMRNYYCLRNYFKPITNYQKIKNRLFISGISRNYRTRKLPRFLISMSNLQ